MLRSLGSEEQAAGAARFIPGLGESYGVPVPILRIIAAELAKWGQRRPAEVFTLVERLWHNGSRDERVTAAKMLERLGKGEWARTLEVAASFVGDIRNWEEVINWPASAYGRWCDATRKGYPQGGPGSVQVAGVAFP